MPKLAPCSFRLDPAAERHFEIDLANLPSVAPETTSSLRHLNDLFIKCRDCLQTGAYRPDAERINPQLAFNGPFILSSVASTVPRLFFKPAPATSAARTEFVTILANLFGIETPLCLRTEIRASDRLVGSGVTSILHENTTNAREFSYETASRAVLEYLVRTRWLNELIGNLECWWGQFLVTESAGQPMSVVMVDLDSAFCSISPTFLHRALLTHFGRANIRLEDCVWLDREYHLNAPLGWAPDHYDSRCSFYGPLWRAYFRGEIELDFSNIVSDLSETLRHRDEVLEWAMMGFLAASTFHHKAEWVLLPAAPSPRLEIEVFRSQFIARCRRAVGEFADFLDEMQKARRNPSSPMHALYHNLPRRPY
jgi:hypothetical protein